MAFDVFKLRDRVVGEYRDYVESFIHIYDQRIEGFVRDKLAEGELWPDAVLQLNPAYAPGPTLGRARGQGASCTGGRRASSARTSGSIRHQEQAIRAAGRGGPVLTSTGTGSGKSLAYIVPIVDRVLARAERPGGARVRAIVVYPMNALANSQLEELEKFLRDGYGDGPRAGHLRPLHRPGARRARARRSCDNPPDILLTNYVMLELMLTRPDERGR